ncbi:restriction endonuclease subunit S [Deinococcus antarcticus]|uniref:Restriction endonuclease subunit S n=1 Tax=Deinococcus antarcticus TaxID=1298767 RepID=A0ABV8A7Q1_9DEIO
MLPTEWNSIKLGDVAEINPETIKFGTPESQRFSYIDISSVSNGVVNWAALRTYHLVDAPSRARRLVRPGDFLLSNVRPLLGAHALVVPGVDSYGLVSSTGFSVIRGTSKLNTRYFSQIAFSHLINRQIRAREVGSSYPAITEKDVAELELPLPPLPEQRRIAEILDTLDRTIEATQRIIEKLQATRQGLLHDLLTRGVDERGQLRDPERHPEQFHKTALGLLPREWEIVRLDDVATKITDGDHHTPRRASSGVLLLSARNILNGELTLDDVDYVPEYEYRRMIRRCFPQAGDILISCSGTIGRVSEIPNGVRCCLVRSAALVKLNRARLTSRFAEWALRSPGTQRQIQMTQLQAAQPNLFQGAIQSLVIPVPSVAEQSRIAQVLDSHQKTGRQEQEKMTKLQALKRGLMEDLLTGRVRVPLADTQVENDNTSASVHPVVPATPADVPPYIPPQVPVAAHAPMYRAAARAQAQPMTEWTQQLAQAVQGQQVGQYSPEALDALLPELLALAENRAGLQRVPEVLAKAGIRFMLLPHPSGSKANGAAFYLDKERTQPVIGLSLRFPYLDVFWFNLLHELAHIRLGHQPVPDESLEQYDQHSPDEQAANSWAQDALIPPQEWQNLYAKHPLSDQQMRTLARKLGRHVSIVAGRYGHETSKWSRVNSPKLRPQVLRELEELHLISVRKPT